MVLRTFSHIPWTTIRVNAPVSQWADRRSIRRVQFSAGTSSGRFDPLTIGELLCSPPRGAPVTGTESRPSASGITDDQLTALKETTMPQPYVAPREGDIDYDYQELGRAGLTWADLPEQPGDALADARHLRIQRQWLANRNGD